MCNNQKIETESDIQVRNDDYLNKIEQAIKSAQSGDVVLKTMEELEEMAQ